MIHSDQATLVIIMPFGLLHIRYVYATLKSLWNKSNTVIPLKLYSIWYCYAPSKMGQNRHLFYYFWVFHKTNIAQTWLKMIKHKWCYWDSIPGRQTNPLSYGGTPAPPPSIINKWASYHLKIGYTGQKIPRELRSYTVGSSTVAEECSSFQKNWKTFQKMFSMSHSPHRF